MLPYSEIELLNQTIGMGLKGGTRIIDPAKTAKIQKI
jgi:hypothetical protein